MEACFTQEESTAVTVTVRTATTLACSDSVPLQSILVVAHNMMSPPTDDNNNMDSNDILSDLQLLEKETKLKTVTGGTITPQNERCHDNVASIFRSTAPASSSPSAKPDIVPLSSIDYGTLVSEITGPEDDTSVVSECTTIDSLSNSGTFPSKRVGAATAVFCLPFFF